MSCSKIQGSFSLTILTLYHTIPTFNDPKEEDFGKHCGKRRKCWSPAFSSFPTVFSALSQRENVSLATFNFSILSCPKICRLVKG